jgi:penicillin-binding protein 1C
VWCGNADGEGRPGLVGVSTAAPILFEIFSGLQAARWFAKPFDDMTALNVCAASGYRAGPHCTDHRAQYVPSKGRFSQACPYHHIVHLDPGRQYQVTSACADVAHIINESWFVLPPAVELYYRRRHPDYKLLPPLKTECTSTSEALRSMELIYPKLESRIYVPLDLDGSPRKTVFEAAHRRPNTRIYWSIDNQHIGMTQGTHQMAIRPSAGKHVLVLTDENGERLTQGFEVLEKMK